jgi:hypothetical protein
MSPGYRPRPGDWLEAMTAIGQIKRSLPPGLNGSSRFPKAVPGCR